MLVLLDITRGIAKPSACGHAIIKVVIENKIALFKSSIKYHTTNDISAANIAK